ncbi:MAG: hypothetical protein H6862_07570 [Rhodospirillales bacterium]|nr:hypothetical protein [Rhodospirillales bacterium]
MAEETGNLYDDSMEAINGNPNKTEISHIAEQFTRNLEEFSPVPTPEAHPSSPVKKSPDSLSNAFEIYQRIKEGTPDTDGVSVEHSPGAVVATLTGAPDPRPDPKAPGVPFGPLCTSDGTSIAGDMTFAGEDPASFEKVKAAARNAFADAASFDPRNGGDMAPVEDSLRHDLGEEAKISSITSIKNDPRCAL